MRKGKRMSNTKFHSDPITGGVCAHDDRTVWKLYWWPGTDSARISGHCMADPGLATVADGLPPVDSVTGFKAMAINFFDESAEEE